MKIDLIEGRVIEVPDQLEEFRVTEKKKGKELHIDTEYSCAYHAKMITSWPKARHSKKMDLFLLKVIADDGTEGVCFSMDSHSYAMARYVEDRLKKLEGLILQTLIKYGIFYQELKELIKLLYIYKHF